MEKDELELYPVKWFDYRGISPEQANVLFVHSWIVAHNRFMDNHKLDVCLACDGTEFLPNVRWKSASELFTDAGFMAKVAALRKFADRHGIQYGSFWSIAFEVLADFDDWANDIDVTSQPVVKSSILEIHQERVRSALPTSNDPMMRVRNYRGLNSQKDYYAYLEKEVKKRHPGSWKQKLDALADVGKYVPFVSQSVD